MFIERLFSDPAFYFSVVVVVMFSIVLHELGHGAAALWEGDSTPRDAGHMDLNPMTHMGPMAIFALLLVGISWGQMPVNPYRFRHGRRGAALVAAAGPLTNLLLMALFALALALWLAYGDGLTSNGNLVENLQQFFYLGTVYNGALFLLNMIPTPPLDGYTVLASLSQRFAGLEDFFRQHGQLIFLAIFLFAAGPIFMIARVMTEVSLAVMGFLVL